MSSFFDNEITHEDLSCAYCGNQDVEALLYCNNTRHWFCNGKADEDQKSHAVTHAVQMHGQAQYFLSRNSRSTFEGRSDLSCYKCQNVNIFNLGYCRLGNRNLRIICRYPCVLTNRRIRQWFPIVDPETGCFTTSIAKQLILTLSVPLSRIEEMEYEWWLELDEDLPVSQQDQTLSLNKHPKLFQDQDYYCSLFRKVVSLEKLEAKLDATTRLTDGDVTLKWHLLGKRSPPQIGFKLRASGLFKEGEKLEISRGEWNGTAVLLTSEGCYYTALMSYGKWPTEATEGFKIKLHFDKVPFTRATEALNHFRKRSPTDDIVKVILGAEVDRTYSTPNARSLHITGLPQPNGDQEKAIRHAFERPITIIEAPPGTGKTTVAAHIAYFYAVAGYRVLLCAPSNIAVDNLAMSLAKTDIKDKMLRIYSSAVLGNASYPITGVLFEVSLQGKCETDKKTRQAEIIKEASVVCCTCVMAKDFTLHREKFPVVIIDECSQADEPEAMIAVSKCTGRLVLIGDSKQLGPVVKSKTVIKNGFDMTLFDRMGIIHKESSMALMTQYRMHPAISEFPSFKFYDGSLKDGVDGLDRRFFLQDVSDVLWPDDEKPIVFYNVAGKNRNREEIAGTGTTYANRLESKCLIWVFQQLFELGAEPCQVSVITMYSGQREYLRGFMKKLPGNDDGTGEDDGLETQSELSVGEEPPETADQSTQSSRSGSLSSETEPFDNDNVIGRQKLAEFYAKCREVQINTVDAYQGRENHIIIVSCVRSSQNNTIGFLSEPRRLNVALTRARCGLILIGDQKTLARSSGIWQELVWHYNNEQATGPSPVRNLIYDA